VAVAGVNPTRRYEKYLGLPALIGRSRISAFTDIKGKIWERINGWQEKFLSQAGKEILLKAVVQAIPTYTMSVFLLPKTLCNDINSMMSRFWWGHKENEKKMAWMSWEQMGRRKDRGGLGYRDLESFNMALLAKQGWRIIQNLDSLVGRIYKEKYFRHATFLDSEIGSNPSYAWRSIWSAKNLLKKGLVWRVRDGKQIKIWKDKWLPTPTSYMIQSPQRVLDHEARVSTLINTDTNWWNIPLIREVFNREEADTICSLALCSGRQEDKQIWVGSKNGLFTARGAYHLAKESEEADDGCCSFTDHTRGLWKLVWGLKVSRVVQHFLWRACNDILPTKEKLHRRGITADALCPICGLEPETIIHILWNCESAKDVWSECCRAIQKYSSIEVGFASLFEIMADKLNAEELQMMVGVARQIWLRRNAVVFGGEFLAPGVLVKQAHDQLAAWRKAETADGLVVRYVAGQEAW
jgi:hypothetical protein